jgi:hypothetical protein
MELEKNDTNICKKERKEVVMVYLRRDEDSIRKIGVPAEIKTWFLQNTKK